MSTPHDPDRRPPGISGSVQDRPGAVDDAVDSGRSDTTGSARPTPEPPLGASQSAGAGQSRASGARADATDSPSGNPPEAVDTPVRSGIGTGPGSVPPWQRVGTGPTPVPGTAPVTPPPVSPDRAPTRTPVTKLDAQGRVSAPQSTSPPPDKGRNSVAGKVIDGPTRNIGRGGVPEDLPDLDAIHHPQSAGSAHAGSAVPTSTPPRATESVPAGPRGPLRAAVQIRRVDPWSTFKVSAILAVALFLIWMIAIGVLYVILDGMGVWDQINSSFGTLVSSDTSADSSFEITAGAVFGIAAAVGAVYVIVFTALTTVGAFIYNMSSDLVGGVEVLLADRD